MLQRWLVTITPIMGGAYTVAVAAPDYRRALDVGAHTFQANRRFGAVWEAKAEMVEPTSDNLGRPPLHVYYVDLAETVEGQLRRECPACASGVLLLRRDEQTLEILPDDNCILCGQVIRFLDHELIGKGPRRE